MDYLNTNLKWEDFFIQESIELEEKMGGFDMDALSKSKLRLSIENKILTWEKYENWVLQTTGCASLKQDVGELTIKNFSSNAQQAFEIYSNYDFWNEDLLPVLVWDNQLIVFGLQYNENLITIKNHIFILARPEVLTFFAKLLLEKKSEVDELEALEKSFNSTISQIEGLTQEDHVPVDLDFKAMALELTATSYSLKEAVNNTPPAELPETENTIWDFITERHEEYCFEAKKLFNAYIVIKIEDNKTKVFKMDPDLKRKNINEKLFEYSLKDKNPFQHVLETGVSETFDVSKLGLELLKFNYVCITALKRGDEVVGFLAGFKQGALTQDDQGLLDDLARESAA
jgi:hypothetical protein